MSKGRIYTAIPSAARTATFNHNLNGLAGQYEEMVLYLDVTAASGTTPTLDVVYQTTNGDGTWFTHTSMTQATSVTTERVVVTRPIGVESRLLCTIGGTTPSFTFSVACEMKMN